MSVLTLLFHVLQHFPKDLSPLIRSFVGTRDDWRTCKKHESSLIAGFNLWTKRVLDDDALDWFYPEIKMTFPIVFHQKELDIYLEDWTMFGRWRIILLTRRNSYWHLVREIVYEPAGHMEDYRKWYVHEFFRFHNDHRRALMR
jgi:hypothetical protein